MSEPRYGIWIPVAGNHGAMDRPDSPRDASYGRAKALLQLAEECGFTTTLIARRNYAASAIAATGWMIFSGMRSRHANNGLQRLGRLKHCHIRQHIFRLRPTLKNCGFYSV